MKAGANEREVVRGYTWLSALEGKIDIKYFF